MYVSSNFEDEKEGEKTHMRSDFLEIRFGCMHVESVSTVVQVGLVDPYDREASSILTGCTMLVT